MSILNTIRFIGFRQSNMLRRGQTCIPQTIRGEQKRFVVGNDVYRHTKRDHTAHDEVEGRLLQQARNTHDERHPVPARDSRGYQHKIFKIKNNKKTKNENEG